MNYEEALLKQIDIYIDEILPAYHVTTVEGMKLAKKLRLFKKFDFMKYAHAFEGHKANALKLESMELRIPEELVELRMLEKDFRKCLLSFVILCDANILFYELNEKKQYKNKDFTIKEYTEAVNDMQEALRDAVLESQVLEKSYKEYLAEHAIAKPAAEAEAAEEETEE